MMDYRYVNALIVDFVVAVREKYKEKLVGKSQYDYNELCENKKLKAFDFELDEFREEMYEIVVTYLFDSKHYFSYSTNKKDYEPNDREFQIARAIDNIATKYLGASLEAFTNGCNVSLKCDKQKGEVCLDFVRDGKLEHVVCSKIENKYDENTLA